MLVAHALHLSGVPLTRIVRRMNEVRAGRYQLLHEFFADSGFFNMGRPQRIPGRLSAVTVESGSPLAGQRLGELNLPDEVQLTALLRRGVRGADPDPDAVLEEGDVLVVRGDAEQLGKLDKNLKIG